MVAVVKLRRGFLLWHSITRSPAQKPACKDLKPKWPRPSPPDALHNALPSPEACV
ncbi:alpha-galactosidase [Lacticaseibacillus zeae]|uniref:Alpha-galactosidase n=1 Tax=Lacticaseibacillus zeae TaxID=57037 RepID=A0A5R8LW93_LACZE|nr:alpha-galactosidase [Lacticaseibacillus zeae]